MPLAIRTIQNHFEINHKEDFANGIYFGLIFALGLYNLFVFILLKDKTYLYYVFYINFLGATIFWLRGYSPEFLSWMPSGINHGNTYELANKMNMFKKEKDEVQAQTLAQASKFSTELIRTQETERKRIAGELHDSVGQNLSVLKNRIT